MSCDHEYVVQVTIDVFVEKNEVVYLGDIMNRVPVEEMLEVLNSAWAREHGWIKARYQEIYRLKLPMGITMEIRITADGEVQLRRSGKVTVVKGEESAAQQRLEQAIAQAKEQYNLEFHQVLAHTWLLCLPKAALEHDYTIVSQTDNIQEQAYIYDMELKLQVSVTI